MKSTQVTKANATRVAVYLLAFVLANFIVLWFGPHGLIITALLLIPFDFVMRCLFHETWKGAELFLKLTGLVMVAALITYAINRQAQNIAFGSVAGFVSAQVVAGIFYQAAINQKFIIKVNGSDFLGIIADSILFQWVAFGGIDWQVTGGQVVLKVIGGLFWYWLIFVKFELHTKMLKHGQANQGNKVS